MRKEPDDANERVSGAAGSDEISATHYRLASEPTHPARALVSGTVPTDTVLLARGQVVDHFKVIELLGRGGMGEV